MRRSAFLCLIGALTTASCSYPAFNFVTEGDAVAPVDVSTADLGVDTSDTSLPIDASLPDVDPNDVGVDSTTSVDSTIVDSTVEDTRDSGVADTRDSSVADTRDSSVADTKDASVADVKSDTTGGCPIKPGPTMVDVGGFCIDSTEVTNEQYAVFLAAKGSDVSGQPTGCSPWNTSFVPTVGWPADTKPKHPVVYVDWCDAAMYCKWAGKRLCGAIAGGPTPYTSFDNPAIDQWQFTCSSNGKYIFPYGDTYVPEMCIDDPFPGSAGPVGSAAGCHGPAAPFNAVFDMSASVYEWTDACDGTTGGSDWCRTRGGSYTTTDITHLMCGRDRADPRSYKSGQQGFRCCN